MEDILSLGVRELAHKIRAREISPVTVVETHLAAIEERNQSLNALIYVDKAGALERAKSIEKELAKGNVQGRLDGVVFSAKESLPSAMRRMASAAKNVFPVLPANMRCSGFIPDATETNSPVGSTQLNAMAGMSRTCLNESILPCSTYCNRSVFF